MSESRRYIFIILLVFAALFFFARIGENTYKINDTPTIDPNNLTNLPTSTPRPAIVRFVKEALKRRPRPTLPPEDDS